MAHLIVSCETLKIAGAYFAPGNELGTSVRWPMLYDVEIPEISTEDLTALLSSDESSYLDVNVVDEEILKQLADTGVCTLPLEQLFIRTSDFKGLGKERLAALEAYRLPEKIAYLEWHRMRGVRMSREKEAEQLTSRYTSPAIKKIARKIARDNVEVIASLREVENTLFSDFETARNVSRENKGLVKSAAVSVAKGRRG